MDGDKEIADNNDAEEEHGDVVGHKGSGVVEADFPAVFF